MQLTCFVKREGNQFTSLCVELDVASCGSTKEEAIAGLKRAIETYIEYMISENRKDKIYRPVPMKDLKEFLFPEHSDKEQKLNAIPMEFQYA